MCILWPRAKALPKCDRYSIDEHVSMCLSSVYCIAWLLSLLFYHNHNNTQMRVYLCLHAYAFRYAFYTVLYTRIMSRKTDEIWEIWAILGELILQILLMTISWVLVRQQQTAVEGSLWCRAFEPPVLILVLFKPDCGPPSNASDCADYVPIKFVLNGHRRQFRGNAWYACNTDCWLVLRHAGQYFASV